MNGYPRWFSVSTITALVLILFVSGCLLIPSVLEFRLQLSPPWILPGGARLATVACHVLGGFLMTALIGALWVTHMRSGWRRRRHRISGLVLVVFWFLLMISGVGIYYFGREGLVLWSSLVHTIAGLLVLLAFITHAVRGRREARPEASRSARDH